MFFRQRLFIDFYPVYFLAGAGLLGGVLLGEAIEDFDRPDVVEYNDTTVNNFGNDDGNDFGGGDFDGGW